MDSQGQCMGGRVVHLAQPAPPAEMLPEPVAGAAFASLVRCELLNRLGATPLAQL